MHSAVERRHVCSNLPNLAIDVGFLSGFLFRRPKSEATFKWRLALVPRSDLTRFYLASLYGHMGRHDEAQQLWSELLEGKPNSSIEHIKRILPY